MSRHWIPTSRRHFFSSSGTSQRWFCTPLECRDVGSQRHDVGCFPLWNVAMLPSHVATLTLFKAKPPPFFSYPIPSLPEPWCTLCRPPCTNPCRTPLPYPSEAIIWPFDTLTDTATTISFHTYQSTVPVSRHPHYT